MRYHYYSAGSVLCYAGGTQAVSLTFAEVKALSQLEPDQAMPMRQPAAARGSD